MKSISEYCSEAMQIDEADKWENLQGTDLARGAGYKGTGKYLGWEDDEDDFDAVWPDKAWPLIDAKETESADAFVMGGDVYTFDKALGFAKFKAAVEKYKKSGNDKDLTNAGFVIYND